MSLADRMLNAKSPEELKEVFKSEEIREFLKALYAEALAMMAVYFLLKEWRERVEALESEVHSTERSQE